MVGTFWLLKRLIFITERNDDVEIGIHYFCYKKNKLIIILYNTSFNFDSEPVFDLLIENSLTIFLLIKNLL